MFILDQLHAYIATHKWLTTSELGKLYVHDIDEFRTKCKELVNELYILQTCHRIEYYVFTSKINEFENFLRKYYSEKGLEFSKYFKKLSGIDVITHLFQVSAGLDSAILGECDILGQIEKAFEKMERIGMLKGILRFIIEKAIKFGKDVRTYTNISKGPSGFSSLTIEYLKRLYRDGFYSLKFLVIGAGELASTIINNLYDEGIKNVVILNRTLEKAIELANKYGYSYDELNDEKLIKYMNEYDICILAISTENPIITDKIIEKTNRKPLIIDLCVPYCTDMKISKQVRIVTIDDLSMFAQEFNKQKMNEVKKIEEILNKEIEVVKEQLKRKVVEIEIGEILQILDKVRIYEIEKSIKRKLFNNEDFEKLNIVTKSIFSKITRPFIQVLKEFAERNLDETVEFIRQIKDVIESEYSKFLT